MTKPKAKIKPETRALKPCPFCGGEPYDYAIPYKSNTLPEEEYWFRCKDCLCSGPIGQSKRDAKILWNGRD